MVCTTSERGFIWIELGIVIAIIGILAAIAVPNFMLFQCRQRFYAAGYDDPDAVRDTCKEDYYAKPEDIAVTFAEDANRIEPRWKVGCYVGDQRHDYDAESVSFSEGVVTLGLTTGETAVTNLKCFAMGKVGATPSAPPTEP